MGNVEGLRGFGGNDCTVLFFILIFLCLFWNRGGFFGERCCD